LTLVLIEIEAGRGPALQPAAINVIPLKR